MKKLDLNKKESSRKEIIWLRSRFATCQYLEGFRWLTSHPQTTSEWKNSRATNLARNVLISTFFRGSKSIKNRYRFCTIWLVGLEEEIIDIDFRQSYWLALQFWVQPNRIFTVGVPQASDVTSIAQIYRNRDVNIVLKYLRTFESVSSLSFKELTLNLTMLLCLTTGQRGQTIRKMDVSYIQEMDGRYRITICDKLKQTNLEDI